MTGARHSGGRSAAAHPDAGVVPTAAERLRGSSTTVSL
jgi:hypothetical protein